MAKGVHISAFEITDHCSLLPLSMCPILGTVCIPGVTILSPLSSSSSLVNSRCAKVFGDLKIGLPYGSHPPCTNQYLLSVTARSSSSILASWNLSFQHLFLYMQWLSLMSCMRTFSWDFFVYSNNIEICAQIHCNHNTSLYNNMQQCDQHGCMSNT